MNTLLKTVFLLSFAFGSQADAYPQTNGLEGALIECGSMKSPVHKISLKLNDNVTSQKPAKFGEDYSATFQSYGPRLVGEEFNVITSVEPITTRITVGVSYKFSFDGANILLLEEIQYSANLHQWPIGFYGTLSYANGSVVKLNCQYL